MLGLAVHDGKRLVALAKAASAVEVIVALVVQEARWGARSEPGAKGGDDGNGFHGSELLPRRCEGWRGAR